MKIDQIAWYAPTPEAERQIKRMFGLEKATWIADRVTGESAVSYYDITIDDDVERKGANVAELQFNYDLGIELEILRYVEGPHWHWMRVRSAAEQPFISHIGIHLDDGEEFPAMEGASLVQETFTQSHTAAYLTNSNSPACGRKYHYRIYQVSPGSYVKYIRRIHPEGKK